MKSKLIVFALFAAAAASAHAASMCIPPVPGYSYTTTDATVANNRGEFTLGGTCSADNTTHTMSCTKTPNARGQSHCSASGVYPAANWEQGGKFCWCKLTDVMSSNGYPSPRAGGWVFRSGANDVSYCASGCANNCAHDAYYYRGFRRALFASPGLL